MFDNRVMSPRRSDYVRYAEALGLGLGADPVELLARSGGARATDTLHIVPAFDVDGGTRSRLFLVSGARHCDEDGSNAGRLAVGSPLDLRPEPENDDNPKALLLVNTDGDLVGYVPAYLLDDIHKALDASEDVDVVVEHCNGPSAPAHLRVLARLVIRTR